LESLYNLKEERLFTIQVNLCQKLQEFFIKKFLHMYHSTLRLFGQGTKVAVELPLMAADAGLVRTDEDVISIGGTGRGADTALVIQPANSFNIFDLKVKAVICKPAVF